MDYQEYLQGAHWKQVRQQALEYAAHRCQICYRQDQTLHVHHRTYERLGAEFLSDLTVLCHLCHERHHKALPAPPFIHFWCLACQLPVLYPRANGCLLFSYGDASQMGVVHHWCPDPEDQIYYDIPIDEIASPEGFTFWTNHMRWKDWWTTDHQAFLERARTVAGERIHA